jgi:Flp pilus assembly protein TadD
LRDALRLACGSMTAKEEARRLFEAAGALVEKELIWHERQGAAKPGWFARGRLHKALRMFERVVELMPESWNSMWLAGKTTQRLGDVEKGFWWMERAYHANAEQVDVAREASMMAMDLGRSDAAIGYAHRATQLEKDDAGLEANLALAYLLAGKLELAQAAIGKSLALDGNDAISKIAEMVDHFQKTGATTPGATRALQEYWREVEKRRRTERR